MTDKEKKKFKDSVISIFKRFNILDHTATIGGLKDDVLRYIDSLQEEPVSEELEKAAVEAFKQIVDSDKNSFLEIFEAGAMWQKEKDAILPKVWNRENLDDFSYQTAYDLSNDWAKETPTWHDVEMACKLGAKWQKEHLWKPADCDDLPEKDREVIVLCEDGRVTFGHRPFEKFITWPIGYGRTEEHEIETYDKGGWNIPNIVYWLDVELPKE